MYIDDMIHKEWIGNIYYYNNGIYYCNYYYNNNVGYYYLLFYYQNKYSKYIFNLSKKIDIQ